MKLVSISKSSLLPSSDPIVRTEVKSNCKVECIIPDASFQMQYFTFQTNFLSIILDNSLHLHMISLVLELFYFKFFANVPCIFESLVIWHWCLPYFLYVSNNLSQWYNISFFFQFIFLVCFLFQKHIQQVLYALIPVLLSSFLKCFWLIVFFYSFFLHFG